MTPALTDPSNPTTPYYPTTPYPLSSTKSSNPHYLPGEMAANSRLDNVRQKAQDRVDRIKVFCAVCSILDVKLIV